MRTRQRKNINKGTEKVALFFLFAVLWASSPLLAIQDFYRIELNGSTSFYFDGKPEVPLILFEEGISTRDAVNFSNIGFKAYSCIKKNYFLDLGWIGPNTYSFTNLDIILTNFNVDLPPGHYLMPRIHVWAPYWWCQANPNEQIAYLDPPANPNYLPGDGTIHESFASVLWKQQAGEALRANIQHILAGPYADRIMGIHIAGGLYGEWHTYSASNLPDVSAPMLTYFRSYLQSKYNGDVEALRAAWNWPYVTFETAPFPTKAELTTPTLGVFRYARNVTDYYEAFHQATVDAIDYFCGIVKQETNGKWLACALYGYEPDLPSYPQVIDHRAAAKMHRLPNVDLVSAPHSYHSRFLGGHGQLRNFPESLRLHNKLFIDEADERTHLAPPGTSCVYATNLQESLSVLNRSFGNMVTTGCGMWYMDHSSGFWYNDPTIMSNFGNIKRWADASQFLPRTRLSEVAVITSMESEFYIANSNSVTLTPEFHMAITDTLTRAGAPYNRYLIEDLEEGLVPEHKVYIFLDCLYMTSAQRAAVNALKNNNHKLVWIFAPGFIAETGPSLAEMQNITDIAFTKSDSSAFSTIYVNNQIFSTPSSFSSYVGGGIKNISPKFSPSQSGAIVWGYYDVWRTQPAFVSKNMGAWTSIYSPTSGIPTTILRHIYQQAGVHVYSTTNDVFVANANWLMIHASSSGVKTITLPAPSSVFNIISNQSVGDQITQFTISMSTGETAIFTVNAYGTAFWKNYTGDHRWDNSANWGKAIVAAPIPLGVPQNVIFHSPGAGLTGVDNYAWIDDEVDSLGGAQTIDIQIGTDGYDSKVLQTGGTLKFRNMFIGLHDKVVQSAYEITGGLLTSFFDGTFGGRIIMGYSTKAESQSSLIVNGGHVVLMDALDVGSNSPSTVYLNDGVLESPSLYLWNYGKIDFRKGKLITKAKTDFQNYVIAGKITAAGQNCTVNDFSYIPDIKDSQKWHITYKNQISDINHDQDVNYIDFNILAQEWLTIGDGLSADIDGVGDGIVDIQDLAKMASEWLN